MLYFIKKFIIIISLLCQEIFQFQLLCPCPNEKSILFNGECIQCLKNTFQTNDSHSQQQQQYMDRFDCPIHDNNNILKTKVNIGANKLNGVNLRVVTIHREPFSKVNGNSKYSGVIFEFLNALQSKYNFNMTTFLPYDGNWGSQEPNGTWNGMVGQIYRKEADIGAAAFTITIDRTKVIDFTIAYHQEPTAILIPAPKEGEKLTVIIRPLSQEVWLALFITIIILIPSFYILHICSLTITNDITIKKKINIFNIFIENLIFITGSLVQASILSPVNKTTRFLLSIWWMTTLVIAHIYIAFLVSYLSVPKLYNVIDSLENLPQQSQLKWTFRKGTAHHSLFKSTHSSGIFKIIGDHVSEEQLVTTDLEGVQCVLNNRMVFIKEKSFLDVVLAKDFKLFKKCRLTLAKENFFKVGISFAIQKNSPFLNLFDYEISNTLSTGIFAKWKTKHWPNDNWCVDAASFIIANQPHTKKLTINDCQGAFFILACGVCCGILGFFVEHLYFRRKAIRLVPLTSVSLPTKPMILPMR